MMRSAHVLAGSLLAAMAPSLAAGNDIALEREVKDHAVNVAKIATGFVNFAGSEDNAVALVESLHEGAAVKLMFAPPGEGYMPAVMPLEPPTGPMEWSDVRMALMLARDALLGMGISRPTAEQLHAVMLGGRVESRNGRLVDMRGVLQMRADGLTWTRIASERYQRPAVARID